MLQYRFKDGVQEDIVYESHGNNKSGGAFMPRIKSVTTKIKKLSKTLPPGKVVSTMLDEHGGVENVRSISQTPRDGQQVRNLKRKVADAHRSRSGPAKSSDFGAIFQLSMKGDFVRSFEISQGGHPHAFCATDQQIHDLQRFCTGDDGALLQIDPTFSVGNFYLTCTTFRHPNFENSGNRKEVLMPGPYFLHATRKEEDYEYFGRTLSNAIKNKLVTCVGTDGEKALKNGLQKCHSFKVSTWVICMLHAKENCQRKMSELGISQDACQKILGQIYGTELNKPEGRMRRRGLVDAESGHEFEEKLKQRIPQWDRLEQNDTSKDPKFSQWFVDYKAEECKTTMLAPIRRKAGLGEPPGKFTTNDVESANLKVKRETDWAKKSWDQAANHLQKLVMTHYEELCRGVYQEGKFRLTDCHKQYEMEPFEWAGMDTKDRRQHLQKVGLKLEPTAASLINTA